MAKTKAKTEQKPSADGNRYTRAARVLAQDDSIDAAPLADRAFISETPAARCKEAWDAVIAALIEVGRLPDPAKAASKKAASKPEAKAVPLAATEAVAASPSEPLEARGA